MVATSLLITSYYFCLAKEHGYENKTAMSCIKASNSKQDVNKIDTFCGITYQTLNTQNKVYFSDSTQKYYDITFCFSTNSTNYLKQDNSIHKVSTVNSYILGY